MSIIAMLKAASPSFNAAYAQIAATKPGTNAERIVRARGVHAQISWISDSSDVSEDRLEVLLSPASQKKCDLSFRVTVDAFGFEEETILVGSSDPSTIDRIIDLSGFRMDGATPERFLAHVLPFDVSSLPVLVQPLMWREVKAWDLTTGDYYVVEFDLLKKARSEADMAKAA